MILEFKKLDLLFVVCGSLLAAASYHHWQHSDALQGGPVNSASAFIRNDGTTCAEESDQPNHLCGQDARNLYDLYEAENDELTVPSGDVGVAPSHLIDENSVADGDLSSYYDDGMDATKDPNLQQMPGKFSNFKAYIRPEISSFYQQPEGTAVELKPSFNGQAGKFINISPDRADLYWEGNDGNAHLIQEMAPWSSGGTATFPGHVFILTEPKRSDRVLCRWTVVPNVSVYYCNHFEHPDTWIGAQQAKGETYYKNPEALSLDALSPNDRKAYDAHARNMEFGVAYQEFTGGVEWLSMHPRPAPQHPIWPAEYFGQVHTIETTETHFIKSPPRNEIKETLSLSEMRRSWGKKASLNKVANSNTQLPLAKYRDSGKLTLSIKAASCAPKAFEIDGFLSDVEVDHLIDVINRMNMGRSTTNGHLSNTRTSRNTWLARNTDEIVNSIFIRAADALRLDEKVLRRRSPDEALSAHDNLAQHNEELQVVHYNKTQEYTSHHDFSFPEKSIYPPDTAPASRSINFCLYLNDVSQGGQTKFPRWRSASTTDGIAVQPKRGKALIFYMVLPDGNLDDLTQHAALPVVEGYKLFTNLWIWDPARTGW